MKIIGLWLLYAIVGLLIFTAAVLGEGVGIEPGKKRRLSTIIVAGLSGAAWGICVLGVVIGRDPAANATELVVGGAAVGIVLTVISMWMISTDLRVPTKNALNTK